MRSGSNLRGGSSLVSFNHVTDPHCHFLQREWNSRQTITLTLTLILLWSLIRRHWIRKWSAPQIRPAPHFVACLYGLRWVFCKRYRKSSAALTSVPAHRLSAMPRRPLLSPTYWTTQVWSTRLNASHWLHQVNRARVSAAANAAAAATAGPRNKNTQNVQIITSGWVGLNV